MIKLNRKILYKKIGIYSIFNNKNNKVYVGSSNNLYDRLTHHISELRKNIHCNTYLQRSFNKYGEDNFSIIVLEYCDIELLLSNEQKWIDRFSSAKRINGYNLCSDALRHTPSEETKKKISNTLRRKGIKPPSRKGISGYKREPFTDEHKRNISINTKIAMNREDVKAKLHKSKTKKTI